MTIDISRRSRSDFGTFVQAKRRQAGFTQRELAERLIVTESAVSKWERGLSYPDISLIVALAEALGVSEGELINASEDHQARAIESQARTYRRWRGSVQWTAIGVYATALLVSFIVNLSVQHALTWFWVVLAAVATAFSLTTLPLVMPRGHRGWITLGAFIVSLIALLGIVQLLYGGAFVPLTVAALLFAATIVFLPLAAPQAQLPDPMGRHLTAVVLGIDSLALLLFLFLVLALTGNVGDFAWPALPITAISLAFVWVAALVIRYLPIPGLYRAAIVTALVGVFCWIAEPVFTALADSTTVDFDRVDFNRWEDPYIGGNVTLLVVLACLAAAVILCFIAIGRSVTRRQP